MPTDFRTQCRVLRLATAVVFAGLLVFVLSGVGSVPFWQHTGGLSEGQRWAMRAVNALPALGYLWALWSVQRARGLRQHRQAEVLRARSVLGDFEGAGVAPVLLRSGFHRLRVVGVRVVWGFGHREKKRKNGLQGYRSW
jgi:hypothetical protein